MLLPAQVLPFLQHADRDVRRVALDYLGEAHDRGAATQDDLWAALNRYVSPGDAERSRYLRWLDRFAPTERSIDRLFHELRTERDARGRENLLRAVTELPVEAKLRLLADPSIADDLAIDEVLALRDDVWLAGQSFEQLLLALDECAAGLGAGGTIESPLFRRAVCVVRALEAHAERAGERALAILRGPAPDRDAAFWEETFAVLIFGRVPMPAFAERLLDILGIDGDLYLNERAGDALVRPGTPEVVEAIERRAPRDTETFRTFGWGVLSQIKIPESEAACLRLLGRPASLRVRTAYAASLVHLCASTPEAFGAIAAMALTGRYDPMLLDLDESVLTLGKMVGWAPDAATWKARPRADRIASELAFMAFIDASSPRSPGPLPPYGARPRRTRASR